MVHMRQLPEYIKELAREIFHRYKGRKITLDPKGKPNPISVFNWIRTIYQWMVDAGIEDIETRIYELADYIDPDLTREENARILYNMIYRNNPKHNMEQLSNDLDYLRELDRQAEEYYREGLKRMMEETAEEVTEKEPTITKEPELDFIDASIIFEDKLLEAGLSPEDLIFEFRKLWDEGKIPKTRKALEEWLDKFINEHKKIENLEITTPRISTVEIKGIPIELVEKIKKRQATYQELEQFRRLMDLKDTCSYLWLNTVINYDDFKYCQKTYYDGKYSKARTLT